MPSPSNPCPAGQGYMAVHQSSHNSACFIAPSVRHRISPRRKRRSAKDAECAGCPISHCPAKKALNCEQQTSWQAGNLLIWTFYKALGTNCTISMNTPFPTFPFMGSNQILNMDSSQSLLTWIAGGGSAPNPWCNEEIRKGRGKLEIRINAPDQPRLQGLSRAKLSEPTHTVYTHTHTQPPSC